jgi:hypothetical protein
MRTRWMMTLLLVGAGCGGQGGPPVPPAIESRGGDHDAVDDVERVLATLAEAARTDDPNALDPLIHPEHGLWIWVQPGAYVVPAQRLTPDGTPPSQRLVDAVINDFWREELWNHVAGPIERGLKVLDRDPPDRRAPVYGDCGADEPPATRAWLATEDLGGHHRDILVEANVTVAPVMRERLVHFYNWGLDVWLARDRDRWWVAHVMVWTPCDA